MLRLLGSLCAAVGFLAWIGLAWKAVSNLEDLTPQSDEGGGLMVWALTGTVLMIVGMVVLHVATDALEPEEQEDRAHSR